MTFHTLTAAAALAIALGTLAPAAAISAPGPDRLQAGHHDKAVHLRRGGDDDDDHESDDDHGGRGRDDDHDDDSRGRGGRDDDRDSNSGRDRPRIPGGSGCDDAGDIAEHAECSL
ncbi:hypothetical protein HKCCE2091_18460 [Rhodobacterales bacterium HKCCE2091]|nr:hypothetical protein [Rhodobacterales bacterium HKCCE2091]